MTNRRVLRHAEASLVRSCVILSSPETADPLSLRDIPLTGEPLHKGSLAQRQLQAGMVIIGMQRYPCTTKGLSLRTGHFAMISVFHGWCKT